MRGHLHGGALAPSAASAASAACSASTSGVVCAVSRSSRRPAAAERAEVRRRAPEPRLARQQPGAGGLAVGAGHARDDSTRRRDARSSARRARRVRAQARHRDGDDVPGRRARTAPSRVPQHRAAPRGRWPAARSRAVAAAPAHGHEGLARARRRRPSRASRPRAAASAAREALEQRIRASFQVTATRHGLRLHERRRRRHAREVVGRNAQEAQRARR
jgi:hypothetical protein